MATTVNKLIDPADLVGKKFQRTGKDVFVEVIEFNEKTRTVIIQFPDGKTMNITTSTLKDRRLWQPYEGEMPEAKEPEFEKYVPGTPEEEPTVLRKPIKKDHKPLGRPKKPESEKKVRKPKEVLTPANFHEFVMGLEELLGCTVKNREKTPNLYSIKFGSSNLMDIYKGKLTMCISIKEEVAIEQKLDYTFRNNCIFPASMKYEYTEYEATITNLLKACIEYANTNNKKKEEN